MNNAQFLTVLKRSFITYLQTGAQSNKKLEVLHGAIAEDLNQRLNNKNYTIFSLGYESGKEKKITGRYVDKTVDITIAEKNKPVAGIAVKYIMSNYKQNSNNYFENMLGETANLRSAQIPYFQIFIIPDSIPYFKKEGEIAKPEKISEHDIKKYMALSHDNPYEFLHTPLKTLVFIVHIKSDGENHSFADKEEYKNFYLSHPFEINLSSLQFTFGNTIVYNDYDTFLEKVSHTIKGL